MARRNQAKAWRIAAAQTLQRTNPLTGEKLYHCWACHEWFSRGKCEVHHILPVSAFPGRQHDPANLIVLCTTCHNKIMLKNYWAWHYTLHPRAAKHKPKPTPEPELTRQQAQTSIDAYF